MYSGTVGPTSIVKPPSPRDMKREQTAGYENAQAFAYMQPRKLPLWSLYMADWMRMDHQVWFGLCVSNAPLMTAKVKVEGPNKRVNAFVQEQWDRIWDTSAPKILRTKTYGYGGYEAVYRYESDHWEFDYLLDRHPRDVKPLIDTTTKKRVGISVTQTGKDGMQGPIKMLHPKGVWLTYCAEFGQHFGRALLERAYPAWYDKVCSGGAYDMRRLRCMKDAWLGDRFRYPLEDVILPDGTKLSARDIARQIGENRTSGAAMALPSTRDEQGNYKWDYEPPFVVAGENQAQLWIENLDDDIFDGLLLPKEVVEAATTGSGFSGRSIPMLAFLSTRDVEFAGYVEDIDTQIIAPLVRLRFGQDADDYDIKPVPLAETFGEQVGQGPAGGAVGQGPPRDGLNPGGAPSPRPGAMQFSTGPHSYASTQLNLPSIQTIASAFQSRIDRTDLAEDGIETESHVTVKYGLADVSQDEAAKIIHSFPPITVLLGNLELFENDEHDVLHVAVDGGEPLRQLHAQLSMLPNQDSHPDYKPHMTIAYLKPGRGKKYLDAEDFKGQSETVSFIQWSDTSGNRLAIPLGAEQFSTATAEARWITIGGREVDGKKHVGGFPVQIDGEGRILKGGPKALRGKHVSQVGAHFEAEREGRTRQGKKRFHDEFAQTRSWRQVAQHQSERWGITPQEYEDVAKEVWQDKVERIEARERAKQDARQRLGITAGDVGRLENKGLDSGSKNTVKGLDTVGRTLAGEYPELGWGRGYGDEEGYDYGALVWDLVREGKQSPPSRTSEEFNDAVEEYLEYLMTDAANKAALDYDPAQFSADWDEKDHPRDDDGQFTLKNDAPRKTAKQFFSTKATQKSLIDGLDALPGQKDLFEGPPEETVEARVSADGTVWRRAKKGGEYSEVTGKAYKGGQWFPVHGLSAGIKKEPKPPVAEGSKEPPKPSENPRKPPERRELTPEQIAEEKERREWRAAWSGIQASPFGKIFHLGSSPHNIRHGHGIVKEWISHAETVGDDQLKKVAEFAKAKSVELAKQDLSENQWKLKGFDGAKDLSIDEAMANYVEHVEEYGMDETGFSKKHMKSNPHTLEARRWVQQLLNEKGGQSKEILLTISRLMSGKDAEQFSADFDESKHPRGQPDNAGQFGRGGGQSKAGKTKTADANAVKDYSTEKFQQINSALRGQSETSPAVEKMVASVDSFLASAPKTPGVTFRQITIPEGREQEFAEMFAVGSTMSDKAFVSTRANATPSVRAAFAGHAGKGTITAKIKGKNGVDISALSENPGETEILYPRNVRFKVVQSKTTESGGILALLEEIDEAEQFSIADPPPRSNKVLDRATEAGNVIADDIRRRLAELLVKKKRLI